MKTIKLVTIENLNTVDIIRAAMQAPAPGQQFDVAKIRANVRVLDAIEKAKGETLLLEDADHANLVSAINAMQFIVASRPLLTILDGILEAKDFPEDEKAA